MPFYTTAANEYRAAITEWLRDTRLLSEAAHRLNKQFLAEGRIAFSSDAWPRPPGDSYQPPAFSIDPLPLAQSMNGLMHSLWAAQFVFLESLWEDYVQNLVQELGCKSPSILQPFVSKDYMAQLVSETLANQFSDLADLKYAAATRFAAAITREPFGIQWKQLARLDVGLPKDVDDKSWFTQLDVYFEMRNCIIHRRGRVSTMLNQKTRYYVSRDIREIKLWPTHLDFFRKQFLDCINFMEEKIQGWAQAKAVSGSKSETEPEERH